MKKNIKILLVGTEEARVEMARALAAHTGSSVAIVDKSVFHAITHYSDDTGFFHRMQDYLLPKPARKFKRKNPFYWGTRSRKELRKLGLNKI